MRYSMIAVGVLLMWAGCKRGPQKIETPEGEGDEVAKDVRCGQIVCHDGQICCNPSCGICAPPDGMCTQQFCDAPETADGTPAALPDAPTSCDNVRCAAGTHCELVEVQCIQAPCHARPECKQDEASSKEQR